MTYSEVIITFNEDIPIDSVFSINIDYVGSGIGLHYSFDEVWKFLRQGSNQVTFGTNSVVGEMSAIYFMNAFNLDYNFTGLYEVSRLDNAVTIKLTLPNYDISNGSVTLPNGNEPSTSLDVDFKYNNFTGIVLEEVSSSYSTADNNPCQNIKFTFETTKILTNITSPIVISDNTNIPLELELLRNTIYNLIGTDVDSNEINKTITTPSLLNTEGLNVNINNSPNGATIILSQTNSNGLELEYSLDDSIWQTTNIFSGIAEGDYVAYVKDQYGCKIQKSFSVTEFGIYNSYFLISNSNSLRFANRLVWGNCANYKNDDNTLSCEADVELPYKEIQQFQSCDVITTQFKSNYNNISVKVLKENGEEDVISIVKKSNYIGFKNILDARKYNLEEGKTGVYFISGNVYDYDTGTDTGEDYVLNGLLPKWAILGNYIQVGAAWHLIENIIYDEDKNADVIVIEENYTGPEINVIVGSVYNLFNYEVYEFTIDMVNYLDQNIKVRINNDDSNFPSLEHLSEQINVKIKQEDTLEIRYKNDDNTDVFYATGIEHKLRMPYSKKISKPNFKIENAETDTNTIVLESEKRKGKEFTFEPTTEMMMDKLCEALLHRFVFIDGVQYVCVSEPEVEHQGVTNVYVVKVQMVQGSGIYNSSIGDNSNQFTSENVEIPGLIDSGNGYVIY